eukprot:GHVR01154998.1.p1 GENE.GHVR01154998.1~~GHVR01154998.1.p1  ORF type:complete len:495 (+),score=158.13 GHVR01154998.1:33-1487(+)
MIVNSGVYPLLPTVKHYAWGQPISTSIIARLASTYISDISTDLNFAELWLGVNTSGVSKALVNDKWIELDKLSNIYNNDNITNIPFLFKILSVGKPLSIQLHPDAQLAAQLHSVYPNEYRDGSDKPELCIALTPFDCLCGFRNINEVYFHLANIPEFASLIGVNCIPPTSHTSSDAVLQFVFERLLRSEKHRVESLCGSLMERISKEIDSGDDSPLSKTLKLCYRINEDFPGDVGVFAALLLQRHVLTPGEAMFIGNGTPHAYLYGECIECMKDSDNVIRCGLTSKHIDIDLALDSVSYSSDHRVITPTTHTHTNCTIKQYTPPLECGLFNVFEFDIHEGTTHRYTHTGATPSMAVVIQGYGMLNGVSLSPGVCVVLSASCEVLIVSHTHGHEKTNIHTHSRPHTNGTHKDLESNEIHTQTHTHTDTHTHMPYTYPYCERRHRKRLLELPPSPASRLALRRYGELSEELSTRTHTHTHTHTDIC